MTEPETPRFHALFRHFDRAGCCGGHAVYLAGRAIDGPSFGAAPTWCRKPWCEVAGRAAWARRPKFEPLSRIGSPSGEGQGARAIPPAPVEPREQKRGDAASGVSASRAPVALGAG